MGGGVKTLKAKGCQPGHPIFSRGANDSSFLFTLLPYLKKIKYLVLNISFPFQIHPSLTYIYTYSFSRAILLLFSFSNHFHISPSLSLSLCSQLSHSLTHRESLAFDFGGWLALLRSSISSLSVVVFRYLRWVCSDPKCYFCFHSCYLVRFSFVYGLRPFDLILTSIGLCTIWFLCVEVWCLLDCVNRSVCLLKLS